MESGDLPEYRLLLNKQRAFLRNLPAEPIEDVSDILGNQGSQDGHGGFLK